MPGPEAKPPHPPCQDVLCSAEQRRTYPVRSNFRQSADEIVKTRMTILARAVVLALAAGAAGTQAASKLDTTTFVVLGEGLAAGMANFGLSQSVQANSFPAQVARQMQTAFPQPLIQGPGIGIVLGYPNLPVRI